MIFVPQNMDASLQKPHKNEALRIALWGQYNYIIYIIEGDGLANAAAPLVKELEHA